MAESKDFMHGLENTLKVTIIKKRSGVMVIFMIRSKIVKMKCLNMIVCGTTAK